MADSNPASSPERARVVASFARALEPALLGALLAATLAALVLVVRTGLLPQQRPLTHAMAFWLWFLAVTVPIGAAAAALAWTIARVARTRWMAWLPDAVTRAGALAVVAVLLLENRRPVRLVLAGLDGPARHRFGLAVALVAATATLAVLAVPPPRRRAWARAGGAVAVGAFLVASFPFAAPHRPGDTFAVRPAASSRSPQRFLLFGIDGADWRYIDELVARGDLPHLAALRGRGAWGPLETIARSSSPIIWNTIATGQPPEVHGIDGFTVYFLRGITDPLPARVIGPRGIGFRRLWDWLEERDFLYQAPISSSARRVPAYWNVATRLGSPVAVLNWWATWPAEPILGSMVTQRMYFWRFAASGNWTPGQRLTWPEDLGARLAPLVMRPEEVGWAEARPFLDVTREDYEAMVAASAGGTTAQGEFPALYSMFETNRRLALALLERGRAQGGSAPDMLVLDRVVDIACHAALRESELVAAHPGSTDAERRRFGRLVSEAYRSVDRALGEVMAAFGEGNVVVVSDHGFVLIGDPTDRHSYYHHTDGPEGIFVAAGPAFRPGRVEGLTVYDVMPMLLHLKGFPVAQDLHGHVPLQVFTDAFRAEGPPDTIASYGGRDEGATGPGTRAVDDEIIERLRALGYVK
jgi:hypothetical protein